MLRTSSLATTPPSGQNVLSALSRRCALLSKEAPVGHRGFVITDIVSRNAGRLPNEVTL